MSTLFAGTSISDFDYNSGGAVTTSSSLIDTAMVSEGITFATNAGAFCKKTWEVAASEVWIGWRMARTATGAANSTCIVLTILSDNQALFQLRGQSSGAGSNWGTFSGDILYFTSQTASSAFTGGTDFWALVDANIHKFDIHMKMHGSAGFLRIYEDGALLFDSGLMNTLLISGGPTTCNSIQFGRADNVTNYNVAVSEIYVGDASSDSRDVRVAELALSANGANTAWTNDILAVDETGFDDSDFIYSSAANDVETYTIADLPGSGATANWLPSDFIVSSRGRHGGTGPQNLQSVVRISGTDYASSNIALVEEAFRGGLQSIWAVSPATAVYWTRAEVNGLEAGVKSIT